MDKLLTTNDVAMAIGASESSLRRWTNSGAIRTSRTVGGHRRIPLSEAIRFIRESGATVVRPELLGFPPGAAATGSAEPTAASAEDALYQSLTAGDAAAATSQIARSYLGGTGLAAMFDGPVGGAMRRVGELWRHDARGILLEHRATDICLRAVAQLRQVLPTPAAGAPTAVGGAPAGDPYLLPSLMAATVLADAGYHDTNFGPDTPLSVLADAAEEQRATLVWLSISSIAAAREAELTRELPRLVKRLRALGASLVVGGRHADALSARGGPDVHALHSMSELAAYARGAKPVKKLAAKVRNRG